MKVNCQLIVITMLCSLIVSKTVHANQLELSVMVGQMFGSDLVASDNSDISTDSGSNIAIGIAWEENVNGQGQVLSLIHI